MLNFASAHPTKPVSFTEIGYRSVAGTNIEPWQYNTDGSVTNIVDPTEQQNCYEAMYEVWSQHSAQMHGVFWWCWPITAADTDYTPWLKPAETVIEGWQ